MKHIIATLSFLLVAAAACNAQKPDPSQYPIAVHVSASRIESVGANAFQSLSVTIGGKHYLLWGGLISGGLLDPGDYRAKLTSDLHKPSYSTSQVYDFIFPDGKIRKFYLQGESE